MPQKISRGWKPVEEKVAAIFERMRTPLHYAGMEVHDNNFAMTGKEEVNARNKQMCGFARREIS